MKKIIRFVTSLITLTVIAFLGLFGINARADDATFTLQQQEALDTDAIRYVSKMTNISNLSEIQYIDVKMQLSKYNSSTSTTDYVDMQQEVHLTKVYKTVNTDGCKEEKTGVYYAVYTLTGLSEYYPGWTITTHFEYVYNSETKVSTNESTYTFPTACKTLPTTVYAAFPSWLVDIQAYMWNSATGEYNVAWPGAYMTNTGHTDSNDNLIYSISNPDGKYNRVIFSNENDRTENLYLSSSANMFVYENWEKTEDNYKYYTVTETTFNHQEITTETLAATATTAGSATVTCDSCSCNKTVIVPATEHDHSTSADWVKTQEFAGITRYTCSLCGETKDETNSLVKISFKRPTEWKDYDVYFYAFMKSGDTSTPLSSWPGEKLTSTYVRDGLNIYTVLVDTSKANYVIFNNGNGWQTVDIAVSSSMRITLDVDNNDSNGHTYTKTWN